MRNIKLRISALFLVLVLSLLMFSGCFRIPEYKGPNPELCSVAWANLVDVRGYCSDGELSGPPTIEILQTDTYGRVLFSYSEEYYYSEKKGVYLLVMQGCDESNASYYPDDCYYHIFADVVDYKCVYDTDIIETLKLINDWEKPMDTSKCESTAIVTRKPEGDIKNAESDSYLEKIVERYYERTDKYVDPRNISFVRLSRFVMKDDYGREMYIVYTNFEEYGNKVEIYYSYKFLMVFTPDGNCHEESVTLMNDPNNAQNDVKQIKEMCGWNTPID